MASLEVLLEGNRKYSETSHVPEPYINEFTEKSLPPFFIISCIDFRVPIEALLDINTRDAFIVRNAGGRLNSSINDLIFIENFTQGQALKNVIVIHHTDCGFTHNTDEAVKDSLKASYPHLAGKIDQLYFGTFGSSDRLEKSVKEDLDFLRSEPLIRQELKDGARGYIYDIKTGKLQPVVHES